MRAWTLHGIQIGMSVVSKGHTRACAFKIIYREYWSSPGYISFNPKQINSLEDIWGSVGLSLRWSVRNAYFQIPRKRLSLTYVMDSMPQGFKYTNPHTQVRAWRPGAPSYRDATAHLKIFKRERERTTKGWAWGQIKRRWYVCQWPITNFCQCQFESALYIRFMLLFIGYKTGS